MPPTGLNLTRTRRTRPGKPERRPGGRGGPGNLHGDVFRASDGGPSPSHDTSRPGPGSCWCPGLSVFKIRNNSRLLSRSAGSLSVSESEFVGTRDPRRMSQCRRRGKAAAPAAACLSPPAPPARPGRPL